MIISFWEIFGIFRKKIKETLKQTTKNAYTLLVLVDQVKCHHFCVIFFKKVVNWKRIWGRLANSEC